MRQKLLQLTFAYLSGVITPFAVLLFSGFKGISYNR